MISRTALFAFEKLLNFYLALDYESRHRFSKQAGEIILMQATDYSFNLYFYIHVDHLSLKADTMDIPTVIIRGKLKDLLASASKNPERERKANQQLMIEGNIEAAQAFRELLKEVSIDWEQHLSRFIGDVAAHQVCYHSRKAVEWGRQSMDVIKRNLSEYLQYEGQCLPSRSEVEDFFTDIHTLQNDMARLIARIDLLTNKIEK